MSLPYIGKCILCGKENEAVNEGICAAHSDEVAQAYLFGFADGKQSQLTAQPDGVKGLRFQLQAVKLLWDNLRGKPAGALFTIDECVPPIGYRAVDQALSAAPAREDGVRERRLELALAEIEGRSNVTTGGHSTLAQRLERIHALAAQALAAPAPACKTCGDSKVVRPGDKTSIGVCVISGACPDCAKGEL